MDFGIVCLASVESRKDIAFAEANGFTHGWLADSQMVWADVFNVWPYARTIPARSSSAPM